MMGYGDDGRGWGMSYGMGWGGWLMMGSLVLVCLAVAGVLIYLLVRAFAANPVATPASATTTALRPSAEMILDERFARGEIDQPDYEQRKQALRGG